MAKIIQYRPAFFEGFDVEEYEFKSAKELLDCPLLENFRGEGFVEFVYNNSLNMIFAEYADGKSWGVGRIENLTGRELQGIKEDG